MSTTTTTTTTIVTAEEHNQNLLNCLSAFSEANMKLKKENEDLQRGNKQLEKQIDFIMKEHLRLLDYWKEKCQTYKEDNEELEEALIEKDEQCARRCAAAKDEAKKAHGILKKIRKLVRPSRAGSIQRDFSFANDTAVVIVSSSSSSSSSSSEDEESSYAENVSVHSPHPYTFAESSEESESV
jgi:hypothetical protein